MIATANPVFRAKIEVKTIVVSITAPPRIQAEPHWIIIPAENLLLSR